MSVWWWVAYDNERLPAGSRSLGCVIVKHAGPEHLVAAHLIRLGLAPSGGTPHFGVVALEWGEPPDGYANRLLGRDDAEKLAAAWDPSGRGLAGPDDIKRAFLDDKAQDGAPLFGKGGG